MKAKVLQVKIDKERGIERFCALAVGDICIVGDQPVIKVDAIDVVSDTGNWTRNAVNMLNGAVGWIDSNQRVEILKRV